MIQFATEEDLCRPRSRGEAFSLRTLLAQSLERSRQGIRHPVSPAFSGNSRTIRSSKTFMTSSSNSSPRRSTLSTARLRCSSRSSQRHHGTRPEQRPGGRFPPHRNLGQIPRRNLRQPDFLVAFSMTGDTSRGFPPPELAVTTLY